MASFFQKFGKSSKEAKASRSLTSEENLDDDLFSGLEILSTPQQPRVDHLNELQDLDLHVPEEESADNNTSAFSFLHQETESHNDIDETANVTDNKHDALTTDLNVVNVPTVEPEPDPLSLPSEPVNVTSSFTVLPKRAGKKNKVRRAKRPGIVATDDLVSQSSCSSVGQEDTSSLSSADVESVNSLEDSENIDDTSNSGTTACDLNSITYLNVQQEQNMTAGEGEPDSGDQTNIFKSNEVEIVTEKGLTEVYNKEEAKIDVQKSDAQNESSTLQCDDRKTEDVNNSDDTSESSKADVILQQYISCKETDVIDVSKIISSQSLDSDTKASQLVEGDIKTGQSLESRTQATKATESLDNVTKASQAVGTRSYTLDLTVDQKLELQSETLRAHQIESRNELEQLETLQNQLISNWRSEHLTVDEINEKKSALFQQQAVLESREEYGAAAELEQQIESLNEQLENFKYQHPILDEKFTKLLKDYHVTCELRSAKKEELKKLCTDLLAEQKERLANEKADKEVNFNAMALRLTEEKATLERSMSHNQLDKEHLSKIAALLSEDIEKKTAVLNHEKSKLIEEKSSIQTQIESLKMELQRLEIKSDDVAVSIRQIDGEIQVILDEFQPKLEKIEGEKKITNEEEIQLQKQMEKITLQEKNINEEKLLLQEEKVRNHERMEELEAFVSVKEIYEDVNILSYQQYIDALSIQRSVDENYSRLKEELMTRQRNLQNLSNKILEEQSNQSRLQRLVNTIETQLSDLQKLKRDVVKDRKYKEAERLSEEIKRLSKEGMEKQVMVENLMSCLKTNKEEKAEMESLVEVAKEEFSRVDFDNDMRIAENLKAISQDIKEFLNSETGSLVKNILQLQLDNNANIIAALEKKHGVLISKDFDLAAINAELANLESQLQKAEDVEDWKEADRINNEIIKTKSVYGLS